MLFYIILLIGKTNLPCLATIEDYYYYYYYYEINTIGIVPIHFVFVSQFILYYYWFYLYIIIIIVFIRCLGRVSTRCTAREHQIWLQIQMRNNHNHLPIPSLLMHRRLVPAAIAVEEEGAVAVAVSRGRRGRPRSL